VAQMPMAWNDWLYFSARSGLAILTLAVAWFAVSRGAARRSENRRWAFAVAVLLIASAMLSAYDGIETTLLYPDVPILPSNWLWFFIYDLPLPIFALLLIRLQRQRAFLVDRLREQSVTDALTGRLNRRGFLDQAAISIAQARRAELHAAMAMIDLDHFKAVNDTYGHAAGDAVLRAVANAAHAASRAGDLIGRLGGDEFGMLIVGPGLAEAVEAVERIRLEIDTALTTLPGGDKIGVSAGVAGIRSMGEPEASLVQAMSAADAALYGAKRSGRDRLVIAEPANRPVPT
jgi:diguanylate cyclase (GGDEF)-like protein